MTNDRTTTLDPERTDQLRTFLTVAAAADAASSPTAVRRHRGGRRLVAGIAAATVLGAGLFAVGAVTGGPSGPARVETAHALEITESGDGWTTIALADIDADPDAVLAELHDAGIAARKVPIDLDVDDQGHVLLPSVDQIQDPSVADHGGFTILGAGLHDKVGAEGLAGLTVQNPEGGPTPEDRDFEGYIERSGVRIDLETADISVRDGSPVEIAVLVAPGHGS